MADAQVEEVVPERVDVPPSLPPVTEAERELAQQAADEFEACHYEVCANLLQKLSVTRGTDPRLLHNRAVVDFYWSGCSKTAEYKQAISESQVDVSNLAALDDVDQCVLFYNHAVLLYHLRQYKTALTVMDKLFQFIEPLDRKIATTASSYQGHHSTEEGLARKGMFLLVELYLCVHQPEKAMGMIALAEKALFGNGKSQLPTPEKDKEGPKEKEIPKDKENKDPPSEGGNDVWRTKISQYKARCYIMLKSIKSCKREVKSLMSMAGMTAPTVYLKANFEYLRGNYRKAVKVLNTATTPTRPPAESGEAIPVMYYNNLGVIHFYMRKHHLGAFYFRKAIQENERVCNEFHKVDPAKSLSGRPMATLCISKHYELLYNLGVQLLHCGKAVAAFDCLIETVHVFQVNPRLWLRLAECCVMAHRASNDEDRTLSQKMKVVAGYVGSGVHRKLLLGTGVSQNTLSSESAAMPGCTLEFAALCLRNALMLLPEDPLDAVPPTGEDQNENRTTGENVLVCAPPGNPLKTSDVCNLRCSILALSSYVALSLNDCLVGLQHAEKLLKQPRLSGAHRYLGNMYMGEALTALDRIADAVTHLNPDLVADVTTTQPEHKTDQDKSEKNGEKESTEISEAKGALYPWSPRDVPRARAIMQYNLATAHAIRGEYEKSLSNLRKCSDAVGNPPPAQMYFLKIYAQLMEGQPYTPWGGRRKVAQGVIKELGHLPHNRF